LFSINALLPGKRTLTESLHVPDPSPVQRSPSRPEARAAQVDPAAPFTNAAGGEVPYRAEMETAFGQDFSSVRATTGQTAAMASLAADGATHGEQVMFAASTPDRRLVAHELTHVVQNRGGGSSGVAYRGVLSDPASAAEKEAESVADRVAGGEAAGPITASPGGTVQRFAPGHHEEATIRGLSGAFSPEEIGATYAANWERDFSQGPAKIANAAIAWRALKLYAADHDGAVGPAAAVFRDAVWEVVRMSVYEAATATSLGGYHSWEHMDQPGSNDRDNAEQRWRGKAAGIAGYLNDSKAYIKDEMVAAVDVYRGLSGLGAVGTGIDNWNGVQRPEGYVAPNVRDVGAPNGGRAVASSLPAGYDDPHVASRDPIREQTRRLANAERGDTGAAPDPSHEAALWEDVGQHLGRAMHAFEDFWAHSNWLELALELKRLRDSGGHNQSIAGSRLMTGTFTMPAKCHALGHKLLALFTAFDHDHDLLEHVYGRTGRSTRLSAASAERERERRVEERDASANDQQARDDATSYSVFSPLQIDSWTPLGEMVDVTLATSGIESAVNSGHYTMGDFLCNDDFLAALQNKAQILIDEGNQESGPDSHGRIAKDQDEPGKDHRGAMALASAANARVFAPLRQIMDERDVARGIAAIQAQLALVDQMLQPPSVSHPLWDVVEPPAGDFPMPAENVRTA